MSNTTKITSKTSKQAQRLQANPKAKTLDINVAITHMLRANVMALHKLRDVAATNRFADAGSDVRQFSGEAPEGARLLRLVEEKITYADLLALIADVEAGLAWRVNQGLV